MQQKEIADKMLAPAAGPEKQATWGPTVHRSYGVLNERILKEINIENIYLTLQKQHTKRSHFSQLKLDAHG